MTSKIKVDNINKVSDDSNIIKKCGSTITLGASGDSIALASGASQTGFGRTGTVDWQTGDIKTATFTAESGKGYFCNTAGGAFEVDLPAGSAGAIVSIQDYNNTFDTASLTVDPNGSEKINGGTAGGFVVLSTEGEGVTLVYIDATVGWRSIHQSTFAETGTNALYVAATGGNTTITEGNFKTHIFTSPGTLCVSNAGNACGTNTVDYFVVAGGGGGGGPYRGSGAGAGGFRLSNSVGCLPAPTMSPLANPTGLPVTATGYPITVGGGGAGSASHGGSGTTGTSGSNSVFTGSSTITSAGGGGGKSCSVTDATGVAGGSGGGAGGCRPGCSAGGAGNTPPTSPPQGQPGGSSPANPSFGGGGGGAGAAGTRGRNTPTEPAPANIATGGAGSFINDNFFGPTAPSYGTSGPVSSTRYFAGGGTGGNYPMPATPNAGGSGGGGAGGAGPPYTDAGAGTVNTGGGGGGASGPPNDGGAGGSGIVVIRYKFQ
jgi:hypothetical protein